MACTEYNSHAVSTTPGCEFELYLKGNLLNVLFFIILCLSSDSDVNLGLRLDYRLLIQYIEGVH